MSHEEMRALENSLALKILVRCSARAEELEVYGESLVCWNIRPQG